MTHPGPNGGTSHSGAHGAVPDPGQQDPGPRSNGQDPGPSSHPQHHISARPVFYVHAPPPPPFIHYQWPMPFYNPFAGFPGMGYGMVMPPFPPPYMEAPAYILPHPHIQAVDYRRLLHPQVHAPSAPYQNPNQSRRSRLPHSAPVRETVNSEVQTEPPHTGGGSPVASSDSGHGTASSSPSSTSSSQKRGSAETDAYTLPSSRNTEDFQVNGTNTSVKHGFNVPHPTGTRTVQSHVRASPETEKSCKDGVGPETVPPCRSSHCNMWSVSTPDSTVPVCSSSQQEDKVVKERRVSIPDILMSWGGGTPPAMILKMADHQVLPQNCCQLLSSQTELERGKCVYQSPAETQNDPVVADSTDANDDAEQILSSKDSETLFKILKLPFALYDLLSESRGDDEPMEMVGPVRHCLPYRDELLGSLNKSQKPPDDKLESGNETNLHEDTTEFVSYQMSLSSGQKKRKMNESVWSVESLIPFIPTKEWLLQNGMFEPEAIVEMREEAENCNSTQSDDPIVKASKKRQTCRFSSSDSVPMSDSWLAFSTPADKPSPPKKPEMENEISASEVRGPKLNPGMSPSGKHPLASPTCEINASSPAAEGVDENRSSEPEANQSPNQESLIVSEQREKSPRSPEQEATLLLCSASGERVSSTGHLTVHSRVDTEEEDGAHGNREVSQQLCVPKADEKMAEVSPPKGHLVDCGIQCTVSQDLNSLREEVKDSVGPSRRHPFKYSDMMKANNGKAEGFCVDGRMQKNQRRHGQWKNRGSETHGSQQEAYNRYSSRPGKSRGGNGRNPQH